MNKNAHEWARLALSAMLSRCIRAVEVERTRLALAEAALKKAKP